MKRFLSVFLILAIIFSLAIPVNAANPTLSVASSKNAVDVGDTVTISVKLSANSKLGVLSFSVKYDSSEFQYVSNSATANELFYMEDIVDSKKGAISYFGVSDDAVTSGGTLLSFKLKALKYGGKITVAVSEAGDEDNKDITNSVRATGTTLTCAHGNTEWRATKPATCTSKGTETGTCPCGHVSTREIPMKDHTVGKYAVTKEPTCTEKGTKKAVCTVCDKEYTEEIKATGHTYGKWTVEKEPIETEKGLEVSVCTACGDKKERAIPVIGSTETTTEKENESSTEPSTEDSSEPTTFEEESSEEPSTQASSGNVKEEKPSTAKTVVLTILATLGIEAIIAGLIFLILKQRKKEKE